MLYEALMVEQAVNSNKVCLLLFTRIVFGVLLLLFAEMAVPCDVRSAKKKSERFKNSKLVILKIYMYVHVLATS